MSENSGNGNGNGSTPNHPKFNPQLYVNSPLKSLFEAAVNPPPSSPTNLPASTTGGFAGQEVQSGVAAPPVQPASPPSSGIDPFTGFFNSKDPNLAILHEKPEHRLLLMLKLRGLSNREIAVQSGYTEPWLSQLFRQPWAKLTMAKLATETGVDELKSILQAEAVPSLYTLIELRDDSDAPAAVRKSCADSILDRHLGKPATHIEVTSTTSTSSDDVERINKELEDLQYEENRLRGVIVS